MFLQTLQQTKFVNLHYFLSDESRRSPGGAAALGSENVFALEYQKVVQTICAPPSTVKVLDTLIRTTNMELISPAR